MHRFPGAEGAQEGPPDEAFHAMYLVLACSLGVCGRSVSPELTGGTMDNPRADKVAVVAEVRGRLEASDAAVLTEYRGLTVPELAALRRALAAAGGDYKVYKNTLVRWAVADGPAAGVQDLLTGPTAIAFVKGDVSAVAKALRDYSRTNPSLVVKGGLVGDGLLTAAEMGVLADLPSRETLLAQLAGAFSAPLQKLASLMQALPTNLGYGLSALVEQRGGAGGETDQASAAGHGSSAGETGQIGETGRTGDSAGTADETVGTEEETAGETGEAGDG